MLYYFKIIKPAGLKERKSGAKEERAKGRDSASTLADPV